MIKVENLLVKKLEDMCSRSMLSQLTDKNTTEYDRGYTRGRYELIEQLLRELETSYVDKTVRTKISK